MNLLSISFAKIRSGKLLITVRSRPRSRSRACSNCLRSVVSRKMLRRNVWTLHPSMKALDVSANTTFPFAKWICRPASGSMLLSLNRFLCLSIRIEGSIDRSYTTAKSFPISSSCPIPANRQYAPLASTITPSESVILIASLELCHTDSRSLLSSIRVNGS